MCTSVWVSLKSTENGLFVGKCDVLTFKEYFKRCLFSLIKTLNFLLEYIRDHKRIRILFGILEMTVDWRIYMFPL